MGDGYLVSCNKCKKSYEIFLGVGMGDFLDYRKIMKKIKKGKFGTRMQEIVNADDFIAIDVERKLYLCEKCGDWSVEQSCDLYRPKDRAVVIQNKIDEWSWQDEFLKTISYDEEKNEIKTNDGRIVSLSEVLPYVDFCVSNSDNYEKILEIRHKCHKCGEVMREIKEDESVELKCPDCGGDMWESGSVCWDWLNMKRGF